MTKTFKETLKPGTRVNFVTADGEEGWGTYACTKESTGSHLVEDVIIEKGSQTREYVWASEVTPF